MSSIPLKHYETWEVAGFLTYSEDAELPDDEKAISSFVSTTVIARTVEEAVREFANLFKVDVRVTRVVRK